MIKKVSFNFFLNFLKYFSMLVVVGVASATDSTAVEIKNDFDLFGNVYVNFMSDLKQKGASSFHAEQTQLGVEHKIDEHFKGNVSIEIWSPGNVPSLTISNFFLKTAYLSYTKDKLNVNFGLIGLDQFQTQQDFWKHRYVYNSYQDRYGFGWPTDFGVGVKYEFSDLISSDVYITNGEGYQSVQSDSIYQTSAGVTISPSKKFKIRGYTDAEFGSEVEYNLALFVGYTVDKFFFGSEYVIQKNNDYRLGYDRGGYSFYGGINISNKLEFFARYDHLLSNKVLNVESNELEYWDKSRDGNLFLAGLEYQLNDKSKVALNYRNWDSGDSTLGNLSRIGLHLEFVF